ncbi:MAG TPA: LytR C-terminal domain-containing protein [Solirubrobacteraceae bacterium]|nr:LytR C-terminal domain-containing protein [Solirubrobacteraceae bacterium]
MSATMIAASAGDVVQQIGSYAGYASIIGLGILALLYFTQAREVKRLREWAGRAPERAAELEERVQADAQKRVVAQPLAPASAAGAQSAEARAQAATAAVYASVGAQPPGASPPPGQLARTVPAPGSVPAAAVPGSVPAAAAPTASAATQTPPAATVAPAPTPTPAPGASPVGRPIVTATPGPPATSPAAVAGAAAASRTISTPNGSTNQDTHESAAARPEPLPVPPPPSPFQDADVSDEGGLLGGLSPARVAMILGGAVATVVVAVVLMLVLTGGEDTPTPQNSIGDTPAAQPPSSDSDSLGAGSGAGSGGASSSALTSAERRATDIAVLNGTTQTGLARAVANKIQEDGFTIVGVDTNADQSVPTTIVSHTGDNEPAALAVAKVMGIDRGSVQAADANTAAAASADVIVIVGSDQIE